MARPRKVKNLLWVWFYKNIAKKDISWIAKRYGVSKRTVWRYLK